MGKSNIRTMTRMALVLALIIVIELLESSFLRMPQGGSISVSSLIFLFSLTFFQWKESVVLFVLWRLLMFFLMPPFYISFLQLFLDYCVSYSGFLFMYYPLHKKQKLHVFVLAIVLANILRYSVHVITGTLYFGEYAKTTPVIWYSLLYNLTYMGPTLVIQIILLVALYPAMIQWKNSLDKK